MFDPLLRSTGYQYVLGDVGRTPPAATQLRTVEQKASNFVLAGGTPRFAETITNWDTANNRINSVVRSGWTTAFDPSTNTWSEVQRYVATFYRVTAPALGSTTPDPKGRVRQVEGPCFVSSPTAQQCSDGRFEVVAYEYGSSGPELDKITAVHQFPNAVSAGGQLSAGSALTTMFSKHDVFGNPGQLIDPNGVKTTFVWVDGRLASATTKAPASGDATWNYEYDKDVLSAVQSPEGTWTVFCHRAGFSMTGGCDRNTTFSQVIRARAIAPVSSGAGASEAAFYSYGIDGELQTTEYLDATGQVRRRDASERDPAGMPTFSKTGNLAGNAGRTTRLFDMGGRLRGLGEPFASAPDFCGQLDSNDNPASGLCKAFRYDEADQLRNVSSPVGTMSCLDYDLHGNLELLTAGAATNTSRKCLSGLQTHWRHDDFGNVVAMTGWWLSGSTQLEWTARGELSVRQTPSMAAAGAWLAYERDGAGRLLSLEQRFSNGQQPDVLVQQTWDDAPLPCGSGPLYQAGRIAWREDATGETYRVYDEFGNLRGEYPLDRATHACDPQRAVVYNWRRDGNVLSTVYPFGRVVTPRYGLFPGTTVSTGRVSAIEVALHDGSGWRTERLVDGVEWEPFGGLRFYRVKHATAPAWASVDYRLGPTTADMSPTCDEDSIEPHDETGQPWKLVVRRHGEGPPPEADTLAGEHVYSAMYEYLGQRIRSEKRCLLEDPDPVRVAYSFDPGDQLYGQVPSPHLLPGVLAGKLRPGYRRYDVGAIGERELETLDPTWVQPAYWPIPLERQVTSPSGGQQDVEFRDPLNGVFVSETRHIDEDGRVDRRTAVFDSSLAPLWEQVLLPGGASSGRGGGLDSVYRTVDTASGRYEYFYDGNNRRRLKVYPSGVTDEFFYASDGAQLLVDVGNDDPLFARQHPTEDYIWLGGQVVAIIRGKLDKSYQRLADDGTDCQRNGDVQFGTACGVYYPVMDVAGRPVVMLDGALMVAGTGESDPFGHVNRVQVLASTDHSPYSPYFHFNGPMLKDFAIDRWADRQTEVRFKLHFYGVDTEPYNDQAMVLDQVTGQPLGLATDRCQGLPECGYHLGETSTWWMQSSENGYAPIELNFASSGQNYSPPGAPWTDKWPYWGVALDRVDYRRSEQHAQAWWPAMRLPGQYYDEETDLFENWNRYYDATTGRYLSPEPMLQSPVYLRRMAQAGLQVPTYAYALNNPIGYVDRNGLDPVAGAAVGAEVGSFAGPAGAAIGAAVGAVAGTAGAAAVTAAIVNAPPINWAGTEPGAGVPLPPTVSPPSPLPGSEPGSPNIPNSGPLICAMGAAAAAAAASSVGAICKLTSQSYVKQGPVLQLWCNYDCGILGPRSQRAPPTGGCAKTIGVAR